MFTYGQMGDRRRTDARLIAISPNLSGIYYLFVKFDPCCKEYCTYIVCQGGDRLLAQSLCSDLQFQIKYIL